ncbi:HAD family hydrolase [[Limnothrix rosea] IAM M-220]|uniref:HAD family hydrolase n=1 Tax=[Limnothrix rosea] IAM M-220 TaxID=454133 RepID=UPI00095FDB0D|nr:HAD family phosphatase [[Limnothrix rosea] IAM M-220]OKH18072.1 hypothetical protein NIES208_06930 [[Limnothrix rosea] IAM M-220]
MDLNNIDAIIFDLGGVIINIDYPQTILAFNALHNKEQDFPYSQDDQAELFDAFEKGQIPAWEFRDGLRHILNLDCSDEAIDRAWNAMLLDIPLSRIELLEALGQHKRLFLLSNTNSIHKLAFDEIFQSTCGDRYDHLDQLFEKAYYSHHIGDRKPNPSIFQKVIDEQKLDPAKTLFIEDTIRHIKGAQKTGLQTYHLTNGETLTQLPWLQG